MPRELLLLEFSPTTNEIQKTKYKKRDTTLPPSPLKGEKTTNAIQKNDLLLLRAVGELSYMVE